eukprot:TRINITY_DN48399_c0_g1_i1.p1 TRINITY_DN48399_c0_g1~~TRINITY_DN48399_c0_g1_i1.p1  ORF type:complete len:553 (-),score=41.87 TRINITY_DN48399_c0_g1_i1:89-1585(-)
MYYCLKMTCEVNDLEPKNVKDLQLADFILRICAKCDPPQRIRGTEQVPPDLTTPIAKDVFFAEHVARLLALIPHVVVPSLDPRNPSGGPEVARDATEWESLVYRGSTTDEHGTNPALHQVQAKEVHPIKFLADIFVELHKANKPAMRAVAEMVHNWLRAEMLSRTEENIVWVTVLTAKVPEDVRQTEWPQLEHEANTKKFGGLGSLTYIPQTVVRPQDTARARTTAEKTKNKHERARMEIDRIKDDDNFKTLVSHITSTVHSFCSSPPQATMLEGPKNYSPGVSGPRPHGKGRNPQPYIMQTPAGTTTTIATPGAGLASQVGPQPTTKTTTSSNSKPTKPNQVMKVEQLQRKLQENHKLLYDQVIKNTLKGQFTAVLNYLHDQGNLTLQLIGSALHVHPVDGPLSNSLATKNRQEDLTMSRRDKVALKLRERGKADYATFRNWLDDLNIPPPKPEVGAIKRMYPNLEVSQHAEKLWVQPKGPCHAGFGAQVRPVHVHP